MPDVSQYTFTQKEIVELLVKKAGVHEGKWTLMLGMGIMPGMIASMPELVFPGVSIVINQYGIQKAQPEIPPHLVVDAAVANPKGKKKGSD